MITIVDESTPIPTPGANPGSDNTPVEGTKSDESTPTLVSGANPGSENNPAEGTMSDESTPTRASGINPGSENTPAEDINSEDSPPAARPNAEATAMSSDWVMALEDDSNEAPGSLTDSLTWANRKLTKLLVEAGRGVSGKLLSMLSTLKKLFGNTKVILVVGQTGTGKTALLKELLGTEDLKPAGTMTSGTLHYELHTAIVKSEQFLFVDTAGFGAADISGPDNLRNIEACLTALGPFSTLVGVIFVFGLPGRFYEHDLMTIQWLECFCGPDFYANITVVTSKWDQVNDKTFKKFWGNVPHLEQVLRTILHPPERRPGGHLYHHGLELGQGDPDASVALSRVLDQDDRGKDRSLAIRNHVEKHYCGNSPGTIQFLCELREDKKRMETEAGKVLTRNVYENEVLIKGNRAVVVAKPTRVPVDEDDKESSNIHQSEPKVKENRSGNGAKVAKENTVPVDKKVPSDEAKGETQPSDKEPETSFAEEVGRWFRLIYDLYRGFASAGSAGSAGSPSGMGAGPGQSHASNATWGSWLFSWFTGPSKKESN